MLPALILAFMMSVSAGVAPGDEDMLLCEQLRAPGAAPIPSYSANMRVLMDSWNYRNLLPTRTGAVWQQVDNDVNNPSGITSNWIQNSNTPCQQTAQVCGFSAGPQNNWLITQLINRTVNGTRLPQVIVMLEFELQDCDTTLNCQRTFKTHIFETSSTVTARDINNYQQVHRVSPADTSGNRGNETITINFNTNHSSFYFAIQDVSTCIAIIRLIIFYYICPAQTISLIHYPETVASFNFYEDLSNISTSATCVENAEPENGLAPMVTCAAEGIWESMITPGVGCRCVQGYFREKLNESETCNPCPVGTYLSPSNNSCSMCPANSVSEEEGLTQCMCIEGYYRAAQGEEDLPCTDQKDLVLLAATLPSVLFCVVLLTALMTLALLLYFRANKKSRKTSSDEVTHNPAMKDNCDNEPNATKEEVYYSTVGLRACAADPETLKMKKNCAYEEVLYYNT